MIKFGVAGNSLSFYSEGNTATVQAADWCKGRGIDLFEYSFGRGVNISSATAESIGAAFSAAGVAVSAHAPYYANFANPDADKIEASIQYVLQTLKRVRQMGGSRIVLHTACQGKASREDSLTATGVNLALLAEAVREYGYGDCIICLETMGKPAQIGTVAEITALCELDNLFYPCLDFGHINALEGGSLKSKDNYLKIFDYLRDRLPTEKVNYTHIHFSKIRYGAKGEIAHLTFEDETYGPAYEPFIEAVHQLGISPMIVCESDGTQAEDAATLKKYYLSL